jgi:hypothetical protein
MSASVPTDNTLRSLATHFGNEVAVFLRRTSDRREGAPWLDPDFFPPAPAVPLSSYLLEAVGVMQLWLSDQCQLRDRGAAIGTRRNLVVKL